MYSNKIFSILATALAVAFAAFTATAVEPSQEVRKYANYYYAYPYPEKPLPELSKAPAGYEPFHMEHYGRHGSRWHVDQSVYQRPIDLLRPAEKAGKLSQRGKETMAKLRVTEKQARDRAGELTPLGARQHQGIGARMARNYPEIFGKPIHIDAKSTEVIRCILSMDNEVQALKAYNPDLDIATDASHSTMYYMNFEDSVANAARKQPKAKNALKAYHKTLPIDYSAISVLYNDPKYFADSVDAKNVWNALQRIAANSQSLPEPTQIWDLFTEQQLKNYSDRTAAEWYVRFGNTPLNNNLGPMRERYLMRNIIESADTAMMQQQPSANLRFGHDTVITPLFVLMGANGLDRETSDLSELPSFWNLYDITPMATNMQMIFYRPIGKKYTVDDILVKVLVSEQEATLPAKPVTGKYYRWSDLRSEWLSRIGDARYPVNNSDY